MTDAEKVKVLRSALCDLIGSSDPNEIKVILAITESMSDGPDKVAALSAMRAVLVTMEVPN